MKAKKVLLPIIVCALIAVAVPNAITLNGTPKPSFRELRERGNIIWYNGPAAIRDDRGVIASWMTSKREIVVARIGSNSGTPPTATVVGKHRYLDDHGAPVLHRCRNGIDKDKLRVIYCLHNSEIFGKTTKERGDISQWDNETIICENAATYPRLCEIDNGPVLLFYRRTDETNRPYCFRISDDECATFSAEKVLIQPDAGNWVYAAPPLKSNGTIEVLFGVATDSIVKDVYHIRSIDAGTSWRDLNGNILDLPIHPRQLEPVWETGVDRETRVWDMVQHESGKTVAIWIDYPIDNATESDRVCDVWWSEMGETELQNLSKITTQNFAYYPVGAAIAEVTPPTCLISEPQTQGHNVITQRSLVEGVWESQLIARLDGFDAVRPQLIPGENTYGVMFTGIRRYPSYQDFDTFIEFELDCNALGAGESMLADAPAIRRSMPSSKIRE